MPDSKLKDLLMGDGTTNDKLKLLVAAPPEEVAQLTGRRGVVRSEQKGQPVVTERHSNSRTATPISERSYRGGGRVRTFTEGGLTKGGRELSEMRQLFREVAEVVTRVIPSQLARHQTTNMAELKPVDRLEAIKSAARVVAGEEAVNNMFRAVLTGGLAGLAKQAAGVVGFHRSVEGAENALGVRHSNLTSFLDQGGLSASRERSLKVATDDFALSIEERVNHAVEPGVTLHVDDGYQRGYQADRVTVTGAVAYNVSSGAHPAETHVSSNGASARGEIATAAMINIGEVSASGSSGYDVDIGSMINDLFDEG